MNVKPVLFYYEFILTNGEKRYVRSPRPVRNLAHAQKLVHIAVIEIKPITAVKYNFIKMKKSLDK
jgi:hypothetical protein